MRILGIETSCDETAAAVVEGNRGGVFVLSNIVSSQIKIHKQYGGVVPEVAAREHVLNIMPVIDKALAKAGIKRAEVRKKIKAIAVTAGPGLITSLMVGVETARALSYVWNIPLIKINHIEGHIYSNFVGKYPISNSQCSIMVLTVSGGHTMLVLMKGHGKYKTIGETLDDAAGEAFDKAAKLLGIGYPGGPAIAAEAAKFSIFNFQYPIKFQKSKTPLIRWAGKNQKSKNINLPRPMINSGDFNFSFSGLKTALLYALKKDKNYKKRLSEYAYEFQQAVIDVLIYKTVKAAEEYGVKNIMLAGGVSANKELRRQITETVKNKLSNTQCLIPNIQYTTDNAAMIAAAGYYKAVRKEFTPWDKVKVDCNLELK